MDRPGARPPRQDRWRLRQNAKGETGLLRVHDDRLGHESIQDELEPEHLEAIEKAIGLPLARLGREEARLAPTRDPGADRRVVFEKRSDSRFRIMQFRFDPEGRAPFNAREKGLLPVYDLDRQAARFINFDGVIA